MFCPSTLSLSLLLSPEMFSWENGKGIFQIDNLKHQSFRNIKFNFIIQTEYTFLKRTQKILNIIIHKKIQQVHINKKKSTKCDGDVISLKIRISTGMV